MRCPMTGLDARRQHPMADDDEPNVIPFVELEIKRRLNQP